MTTNYCSSFTKAKSLANEVGIMTREEAKANSYIWNEFGRAVMEIVNYILRFDHNEDLAQDCIFKVIKAIDIQVSEGEFYNFVKTIIDRTKRDQYRKQKTLRAEGFTVVSLDEKINVSSDVKDDRTYNDIVPDGSAVDDHIILRDRILMEADFFLPKMPDLFLVNLIGWAFCERFPRIMRDGRLKKDTIQAINRRINDELVKEIINNGYERTYKTILSLINHNGRRILSPTDISSILSRVNAKKSSLKTIAEATGNAEDMKKKITNIRNRAKERLEERLDHVHHH